MIDYIYFFDTYALYEVVGGNGNYKPYIYKDIVITKLNLFELYYNVLREFGEADAEKILAKYSFCAVDYDEDVIREAAKFRLKKRSRDLSMADCIGYIISKRLKIRFLTGDKEFEGTENVEFVR